jgi:hypothetical protein
MKPLRPGEVKYSLLAIKVTFLGTTRGMNIESLNERWFDATITGPIFGTFLKPVTLGRKSTMRIGVRNDFRNVYAIPRPLFQLIQLFAEVEETNLGVNGHSVTPSERDGDIKLRKSLPPRRKDWSSDSPWVHRITSIGSPMGPWNP